MSSRPVGSCTGDVWGPDVSNTGSYGVNKAHPSWSIISMEACYTSNTKRPLWSPKSCAVSGLMSIVVSDEII